MDFIPPQISTELVIHTHVPLYFHLLSPCVKCYCLKRMKSDNTLHQWLEKKYSLFLKSIRSVVEVWQKWNIYIFLLLKYFANLIVKVPHNRKYEGFFCVY